MGQLQTALCGSAPKIRVVCSITVILGVGLQVSPALAAPTCLGKEATIVGSNGSDELKGTKGNDVILAKGGDDVITGVGGNDRICGGGGRDQMDGGKGIDRMDGGAGPDEFIGGADMDWAIYEDRTSKVDIVIDDQANDGDITGENDFVDPSVEGVIGGQAGDGIVGGPALDVRQTFKGGPGDDDLFGGGGNDRMFGESGDDSLFGQDGDGDFGDGGPDTDECDAEQEVSCEV